jgi:plastocyanin
MFCEQDGHCQQGMVFAINPGDQFAAFQAAARNTSNSTQPSPPVPSSNAPTPNSHASDHKIIVGGAQLGYHPPNITAQPGDTITFEFHQVNHTLTQSSFDAPCRPIGDTCSNHKAGFDSGLYVMFPFLFSCTLDILTPPFCLTSFPVAANATQFPTYTLRVNDTAPIYAYCRQGPHCGQGMVFSVNADESGSKCFGAFQARAKQINGTA